jgi:hypothetical protein
MKNVIREQINKVKNFEKLINENVGDKNSKSIINLIFSENEIEEIYRIKDDIASNYLDSLDVDPFTNEDDSELVNFVKNTMTNKGVEVSDEELKIVLDLINRNILI